MNFIELHNRKGERFMIDLDSQWEIKDCGSEPAHWDNRGQGRNLNCRETYEELRAKLLTKGESTNG